MHMHRIQVNIGGVAKLVQLIDECNGALQVISWDSGCP